eukprot:4589958-Pleurochrysis_carterae.AAC.1
MRTYFQTILNSRDVPLSVQRAADAVFNFARLVAARSGALRVGYKDIVYPWLGVARSISAHLDAFGMTSKGMLYFFWVLQ